MKFLGFEIKRVTKALNVLDDNRGWWPLIREPFSGAWQSNSELTTETKLSFYAVYACITLIAGDIAKLRFKLIQRQESGIWKEIENPAFSPVLRRPNAYQTQIQFREFWILSKLSRGNVYVLKERDNRGIVIRLHILDPNRVTPLVSDSGDVFYRLSKDNLSGIEDTDIVVPAREIIHDRMNCLFHPLIGIPPLFAATLAAGEGLAIQKNQKNFFGNQSLPSGILTTPGNISPDAAKYISDQWKEKYGAANYGGIAVLGNDLKFAPLPITAVDSQLTEQLKLSAEVVCSTFHVPPWMIGIGDPPAYNNVQSLFLGYYNQTLQKPIEEMEACLDEGLGLDGRTIGVELDIDALLRMDTATRYEAHSSAIKGGWMAPNEARFREDLIPKLGGDSPYLQQQNYSLAALAMRDSENPLGRPPEPSVPEIEMDPEMDDSEMSDDEEMEEFMRSLQENFRKSISTGPNLLSPLASPPVDGAQPAQLESAGE